MGWAERCNPNSEWNKKRSTNFSSKTPSPIITNQTKAMTPVLQDEPKVIQITLQSVFWLVKGFLWQTFRLNRPSPAQTS